MGSDTRRLTEAEGWDLFLLGAANGGDPGWHGEASTTEQKAIRAHLRVVFNERWNHLSGARQRDASGDLDLLLVLVTAYIDMIRDEGVGMGDSMRFETQIRAFIARRGKKAAPNG